MLATIPSRGWAVRRLVAVAAALTAVTTACSGSAVHRVSAPAPIASPTPSGAVTPGVTSSASAPARPAPTVRHFAAAAGVPWASIGPGWFLAVVDSRSTRLLLVDPHGKHYAVYTASGQRRIDGWSGDGQRG